MKTLATTFCLFLMAIPAFAANSVISFTDRLTTPYDQYQLTQTETANPLLTQLITNNLSHTITLSATQSTENNPIVYFSLRFNGTGTGCIVRLMNTTTKASYVAYPVAAAGVFGMGIHPKTLYVNYSSCYN